jgi:hypothetical protein
MMGNNNGSFREDLSSKTGPILQKSEKMPFKFSYPNSSIADK